MQIVLKAREDLQKRYGKNFKIVIRRAGLQNRPGRVAHGLLGSAPGPLHQALSVLSKPITGCAVGWDVAGRSSAQDRLRRVPTAAQLSRRQP